MNQRQQSERHVVLEGYVEGRIAKGDQRSTGYPQNGLPNVSKDAAEMKSSFLIAVTKTIE